jgi:hypothetical protein
MTTSAARGCKQGGVISSLLWSLVMDRSLWELYDNDYYTVGYADYITDLINGIFPLTVSGALQTTLCIVQ